jgi:hypothetical protein
MKGHLTALYLTVTGKTYVGNHENHVVAQKIIYLLAALGMSMGDYRYVWGENGPYSIQVHEQLAQEIKDGPSEKPLVLSAIGDDWVKTMSQILTTEKPEGMEPYSWLELISSTHCVAQTKVFKPLDNKDLVFTELDKVKGARFKGDSPVWDPEKFNKAWDVLVRHRFF